MRTAKQETLDLLDRLPDDVPMDTILAQLHFKAIVLRGLEQARRGEVVSQEEVKARLNKWIESSGQTRLTDI